MAYSDFDFKTAVHTFALTEDRDTDLFHAVEPIEPSEFLRIWLDKFAPAAQAVNSEKARSEFIIAPILAETKLRAETSVTLLSGVPFEVDKGKGLTGFCDFLIARTAEIYYIQGPIVAVVEAKREDLIAGLGQCTAEMVAIRLFNERDGTPIPAVFGCVTSGTSWRFLKLEESKLSVDRSEYGLRDVAKILGILLSITRA